MTTIRLQDLQAHQAPDPSRQLHVVDAPLAGASEPPRAGAAAAPAHRRRSGWFEANPGCFARVVGGGLGAVAAGMIVFTGVRRLQRTVAALRLGLSVARRVGRLGRHAAHRTGARAGSDPAGP